MKILDKFTLFSVIKILFVTLLLCTLMLLSVDLFSKFDSYAQHATPLAVILKNTILYGPSAIVVILPPATLFTLTFFLSQLYANNEIIALMSSGFSMKRILTPLLLFTLLLSVGAFFFNETIAIPMENTRQTQLDDLFGDYSQNDNTNITLFDNEKGYIINANRYIEKNKTLTHVTFLILDKEGRVNKTIASSKATYTQGVWHFINPIITTKESQTLIRNTVPDYTSNLLIDVTPKEFRNNSHDIETMDLTNAISHLQNIHKLDRATWYVEATEFYDRLFMPFTIFVMAWIACITDYRNKRNVFLFSIFNSIVIALVYYVGKMLLQIMSRQMAVEPIVAIIVPYIVIFFLPYLTRLIGLKNE